ncbi:MAG: sterol carrier family protein [Bifidobacteriaceae bacterium]|jgi:hypothetical protein|nr:sterol carrier family protein [Bifidobacteriaceae bacterium]
MANRRRIEPSAGAAALAAWRAASVRGPAGPSASQANGQVEPQEIDGPGGRRDVQGDQAGLDRAVLATAVRYSLEELAAGAPGNAVEVRVPPFGAVQCLEGPRHTRGTPPNLIETVPEVWLALVTGQLTWSDAVRSGRVQASGSRADLSDVLPLTPLGTS